ncbi:MAG: hypothetical protein PF689_01555 [Deltaproteobacteria bacterium]|nr:hypothetical protein [Deltaproteobacteria bacterium]
MAKFEKEKKEKLEDPQKLFDNFSVFKLIKPMAGTFHVVELSLEDTSRILDKSDSFSNFHDQNWLKIMGYTLLYSMNQKPRPFFGYCGTDFLTLIYKINPELNQPTELISNLSSLASSFLGLQINNTVNFSGNLLEFPDPKILTAYLLWKQNNNRNLLIQSMALYTLISQGKSSEDAKQTIIALGDNQTKLSMISDHNQTKIPNWHLNGICSFWDKSNDKIQLAVHENLPSGPDFLNFLIELFDQE